MTRDGDNAITLITPASGQEKALTAAFANFDTCVGRLDREGTYSPAQNCIKAYESL